MNRRRLALVTLIVAGAIALTLNSHPSVAQPPDEPTQMGVQPPPQHEQPYALELRVPSKDVVSPSVDQPPTGVPGASTPALTSQQVVRVDGATWLRLYFEDFELGPNSYVLLTSIQDGSVQRLDAGTLALWGNSSAYFNGDTVKVELYATSDDPDAFVRVHKLSVGEPDKRPIIEEPPGDVVRPQTVCDTTDDRVASSESRVGRLYRGGCTAWLVSNGTALTAGHCVDFDPDQGGPLLPDGVLDLNGVVEFNVPASNANGSTVWAAAQDQYPINTNGVQWRFDGEGQGLGKDWAVFRINPNTTTGGNAHIERGFFRMTNDAPAANSTIRITGFGADTGTANFANQTTTGGYVDEIANGADIRHRYRVDTEGGNSGSPVIWDGNGFTIGIHTNGGCGNGGSGANSGTSFEVDALETAIQNFPNANTRYVDSTSLSSARDGTIFRPFATIGNAVNAVPAGGVVSIVTGSYGGSMTINKAVTLVAPVGNVTIGQ